MSPTFVTGRLIVSRMGNTTVTGSMVWAAQSMPSIRAELAASCHASSQALTRRLAALTTELTEVDAELRAPASGDLLVGRIGALTQARDFAAITATEVYDAPAIWVSATMVDALRASRGNDGTPVSPDVLLLDRVADRGLLLFEKAAGTHECDAESGGLSPRDIDGLLWWRWNPLSNNESGRFAAPHCVIIVLTRAAAGMELSYLLVPMRPGIALGIGQADAVALLVSLAACPCAGRDVA